MPVDSAVEGAAQPLALDVPSRGRKNPCFRLRHPAQRLVLPCASARAWRIRPPCAAARVPLSAQRALVLSAPLLQDIDPALDFSNSCWYLLTASGPKSTSEFMSSSSPMSGALWVLAGNAASITLLLGDAASVTEGAAATDEVSNAEVTARGAATTGVVAIGAVLIATCAAFWASAAGAALGVAGAMGSRRDWACAAGAALGVAGTISGRDR